MELMQIRGRLVYWISQPRDFSNGADADQVAGAGWFTGLANQGTTEMVLIQIRGWLACWISQPRDYRNGANTDQEAIPISEQSSPLSNTFHASISILMTPIHALSEIKALVS
ncbi:hypothetical protein VNO77_32145 [Canavalia gladiata]|uniref:Uncharacterized protein n=1 Tax=Canavalia gladiata TaxID=3824 RepID=A0AAN9Q4Y5_CANGL